MYPSEEQARRDQWQDELDAATRNHAMDLHDSWHWDEDDTNDVPADVAADFEE